MIETTTGNRNLSEAKRAKNDEFYTQYHDIEKEINAYLEYNPDIFRDKVVLLPCDDPEWSNFTMYFAENFERLGLKKLISTSYAPIHLQDVVQHRPSKFEIDNPNYDDEKSINNGKVFTLARDVTGDGKINYSDLEWEYLEEDGDFRSAEVTALRDEADFIITNPPFSLFREFLAWIMKEEKSFLILGNMNAITYKEVFPLIKDNKIWLGVDNGAKEYTQPDGTLAKMGNTVWYTNMEHQRRHQSLQLMTMEDNLKYNKKISRISYPTYDNYDAIEVPFTNAIPSDYEGVMGVPISFLDKYCPEQFEILGSQRWAKSEELLRVYIGDVYPPEDDRKTTINGRETYDRIFIKHKK